MRRAMFWTGWAILILLPIAFVAEGLWIQNLPVVQPWQWSVPVAAIALIILGRNRDDVLRHHLAH